MTAARPAVAERLAQLAAGAGRRHLRELFAQDPGRAGRMVCAAAGITLDYSRQRVDGEVLDALLELARARDMAGRTRALFAGEPVNATEGRAALHMALRAPREADFRVAGRPVMHEVHAVLDRMHAFCREVRGGQRRGAGGEPFTDVVNIGIGGSDLGPRMVCRALGEPGALPRAHFLANVDGGAFAALTRVLDPARTLFIVTSKTFTTQETMANAAAARQWIAGALGEEAVARHFVAVSTNLDAVRAFGIPDDAVFGFWDWVGGRYSLWSAVGLSIALHLGFDAFRALLDGAAAMDEHFRSAPAERNLPLLMALIAYWNRNLLGMPTQVVVPYRDALELFVPWLQQLEMESNGKSVALDGTPLAAPATPALWGGVGTNAQHAFFQMLHQGMEVHPVDFILPLAAGHGHGRLHRMLVANCIAQASALAFGRDDVLVRAELAKAGPDGAALEAAVAHRRFPGNRPSSLLTLERLDARGLGALLALYEHRCFALSVLWGNNAFDQFGVELGKRLAGDVLAALEGREARLDAAGEATVRRIRPALGDPGA